MSTLLLGVYKLHWLSYLVITILIAASQLSVSYGLSGKRFFGIHSLVGGAFVLIPLYLVLQPAWRFLKTSSEYYSVFRGFSEYSEVIKLLGGMIKTDVSDVLNVQTKLKEKVNSFDGVSDDNKSLESLRSNIDSLVVFARHLSDDLKKLWEAIQNEEEALSNMCKKAVDYQRTKAQLKLADQVWIVIHGFVFFNIGFGGIYYGIWGNFNEVGLQAFNLPLGSSITLSDFLYYSVVTVTTLGYGDISPRIWQAQLCVAIHALFSLIYIVGIIGTLLAFFNSDEMLYSKASRELYGKSQTASREALDEIYNLVESRNQSIAALDSQVSRFKEEKKAVWKTHKTLLQALGHHR